MSIKSMIEHLQHEQAHGATHVVLRGEATLLAQDDKKRHNSVVIATEPQM